MLGSTTVPIGSIIVLNYRDSVNAGIIPQKSIGLTVHEIRMTQMNPLRKQNNSYNIIKTEQTNKTTNNKILRVQTSPVTAFG